MINALDFTLDGIKLSSFERAFIQSINVIETQKGINVNIYQESLLRRAKPYYHGSSYSGNKKFSILIGKDKPMTETEIEPIKSWLQGHIRGYRNMTFVQDDLSNLTFKVIITSVSTKYIGNQPVGLICEITCDSPYAYEPAKTYTFTKTTTSHVCNTSANDYVKPKLVFKSTASNSSITISNRTTGNTLRIINALQDEIFTINNDLQIIASNLRENIMANFDAKWFYLVKGNNELSISGSVNEVTCTYANERMVL